MIGIIREADFRDRARDLLDTLEHRARNSTDSRSFIGKALEPDPYLCHS
jgi:hypothetical protein